MKIVLVMDKYLYQKLYMEYPKYDDQENIVGSIFDEDEYDNYHIIDRQSINLTINPLDGIKDIYMVLIQKSWYNDRTCINICKYIQTMHPEAQVVFWMDGKAKDHPYLCHRMVSESLGYVADGVEELNQVLSSDFQIYQRNYVLENIKKGQLKKMKKAFLRS
ncbi:hypothetical protein [Faecalicoccus pleomorphus]|uniref:hypothetical protein n=1 Tax=Faecalicoccus pleomorphus TaxID=1323 RepID=UPI0026EE6831|nr:hypothetical protein [Faecalicoccus pleomorphus]